jgi:hypothetical protein
MGNSTIALPVARQMQDAPVWLDSCDASAYAAALIRAAATHRLTVRGVRPVILGDVTFEGDSRPAQDAIAAAGPAIVALGGTMLITGTAELPHRLRLKLGLSGGACQRTVSGLEDDEINQLLELHGLSDDGARRHWAKRICLQTGGHPQLVDARAFESCAIAVFHASVRMTLPMFPKKLPKCIARLVR